MLRNDTDSSEVHSRNVSQQLSYNINVPYELRVLFNKDCFNSSNALLKNLLLEDKPKNRVKVLVYIDKNLATANIDLHNSIKDYFDAHKKALDLKAVKTLPGGEDIKNDESHLKSIFADINDNKICRHSYIIAIGGGALLDVVGFAAATAHRGIRHIRLPSTTLAQGDSGVGVKNGVNYKLKKNFIGSFAPPFAVINDSALLESLPSDECRNGYIEAIKVALIKDKASFEWIVENADKLSAFDSSTVEKLIYKSADLHLHHIATSDDPFELGSTRPLDFGHWSAHKLEQLSHFSISHGEAVAIGIALDVIYSESMGYLDKDSANTIIKLLQDLNFSLYADELSVKDKDGEYKIILGLEEFREHLGGELTICLLNGIGSSFEVHSMDKGKIILAIEKLRSFHSS